MYNSTLACLLLLVATSFAQNTFPAESSSVESVTTENENSGTTRESMTTESSETTPCEHEGSGGHPHHHRGGKFGGESGREEGRIRIRGDRGNEGRGAEEDHSPFDTFRGWMKIW